MTTPDTIVGRDYAELVERLGKGSVSYYTPEGGAVYDGPTGLEDEAATAIATLIGEVAEQDGAGWVYFNEDSGEEYGENHPVESGECPDATDIRRSTGQEDHLWSQMQEEFTRATAAEAENAKLREALQTIVDLPPRKGWTVGNCRSVARSALNPKQGEGE